MKNLSQFKLPIIIKIPSLSLHLFNKPHSAFKTTREDFLRSKSYWRRKFLDTNAKTDTTIFFLYLGFWVSCVLLFCWKIFLTLFSLLRLSYQRIVFFAESFFTKDFLIFLLLLEGNITSCVKIGWLFSIIFWIWTRSTSF